MYNTTYNSQDRSLQEGGDAASVLDRSLQEGGDAASVLGKNKRKFVKATITSGSPLHVFNTLMRLNVYPDNEIKAALQEIRMCFEEIKFNRELMKCLKNAISLCSNFLVFFFSPAPASADAVPSSMAVARTADHFQNDNDEGILLNILIC